MTVYTSTSGGGGPPLTISQASNPNDNTEGTVSGKVLAAAVAALAPQPKTEFFTPTAGQTVFQLANAPAQPNGVKFFVNGDENSVPNITVQGVNVTWTNADYALGPSDTIVITYV